MGRIRPVATSEGDKITSGVVLADVRIGDLIGRGPCSQVFAGRSELTGRPCAVKVFCAGLDVGSVRRGRFVHIAQQVSQIGAPGLVSLYTVGALPAGRPYAITELAPGKALSMILRDQAPLDLREFLPLFKQICTTLGTARARGWPHLRLHGGNIMVRARAHGPVAIKLLDFGVYQLYPPANQPPPGLALQPEHAAWVAPEQIQGDPGDARSDVYALGVLLYHMTTGQPPFLGADYASTLDLHLSAAPRPPGELAAMSPDMEASILRALEKDPRKRVPSVEALLSAIDPVSATTGRHLLAARTQQARQRHLSTGEYRLLQQRPADRHDTPPSAATAPPEPEVLVPTTPVRIWQRKRLVGAAVVLLAALVITMIGLCTGS